MFLRQLLLVFVMPIGFPGTAEKEVQPITWWITSPLEKVKPLDPAPNSLMKMVDISAGGNEFEPFQIVMQGKSKDLSGVDIEVSDFRTIEGAEISRKNVTVYLEKYLQLDRPSSLEGAAGLWPDPLIPRTDRYANERRNAFPFIVRRGRNQPIWVEIYVPPTASPGQYTGSASISLDGSMQFSVPIRLTVWNFVLPSTATLKSSFGLSGSAALKQHRGAYTNEEDLHSITRLYAKAALFHRLSVHVGSMVAPTFTYNAGRMQLDWRVYDAEIGPFLDGTVISEGEPLYGARATSVDLRTPGAIDNEEKQVLYWTEWTRHFQQKGWLDRLFLYLWDEPTAGDFPKVLQRGRVSRRVAPKVRNLVTTPFSTRLDKVVDIWVPLVNCLESNPDYADFCGATPPRDVYVAEIQQGKSLWFYQSCASHGCNIVGGQYFNGWPSYVIDMPGGTNRVMQWLAWKYRMEGELYYSVNEAYSGGNDPWTNVRLFGGNGDGTLFYPGTPDRIGGHTGIPIESIRLKLIREGMEDYEYLALLARLRSTKAAGEYAEKIVKKPYLWESSPEILLRVRQELGEALDKLMTSKATG